MKINKDAALGEVCGWTNKNPANYNYQQYRIVKDGCIYRIDRLCYNCHFGLPSIFGGRGLIHWRFYWNRGLSAFSRDESCFSIEHAKAAVHDTIQEHLAPVEEKEEEITVYYTGGEY